MHHHTARCTCGGDRGRRLPCRYTQPGVWSFWRRRRLVSAHGKGSQLLEQILNLAWWSRESPPLLSKKTKIPCQAWLENRLYARLHCRRLLQLWDLPGAAVLSTPMHLCTWIHFAPLPQVIQDKKSSNKFACAICCEKQSVRRILHSSPAAKDCRVVCQVSGVVAHACPECRAPGYLLTQGAGATLGASSQQSLNMVSAPSEGRRAVQRCASRIDRTCTAGARAPRVRQARLWHRRWRRGAWVLRGRVRRASSTRSACSAARAQPMESVRGGARRTRGSI